MTHINTLYTSSQIYDIEKSWFNAGNDSFSLMQQASWQMANWIEENFQTTTQQENIKRRLKGKINQYYTRKHSRLINHHCSEHEASAQTDFNYHAFDSSTNRKSALVWVGSGNNGGDGWLIAHYLRQLDWEVLIIEVAEAKTRDSQHAKSIAIKAGCVVYPFQHSVSEDAVTYFNNLYSTITPTTVFVDAIFGIGLDRQPAGIYAEAIVAYNNFIENTGCWSIAVDIPSGLVASTGQVFVNESSDQQNSYKKPKLLKLAIRADVTLCLIAKKIGLFTKDGKDHAGQVVSFPLIPIPENTIPVASRLTRPLKSTSLSRPSNSHKGSFGHVLVIGGNKTQNAQGMGGASILTASGAFAVGVGKVSVACHIDYHGALLTHLPNAMTMDLQDIQSVSSMMHQVEVVAIGMGLGREKSAQTLFIHYLHQAMAHNCDLVIDADGLYHLADTTEELQIQLKNYSTKHFVAYTPHAGEMAKLLTTTSDAVEADRLSSIKRAVTKYGGNWLLKGAGSLVIEDSQCVVCDAGNSGMATAGMGDVLSGVISGLVAQKDLSGFTHPLTNAVLIHASAGDVLAEKVGEHGLQAKSMAEYISIIIAASTT